MSILTHKHSILFLYLSRLMPMSVVVSQDLKVYTVRWTSMSVPVDPVRMEVSAMIRLMATYAGALQVCCWQVMASDDVLKLIAGVCQHIWVTEFGNFIWDDASTVGCNY